MRRAALPLAALAVAAGCGGDDESLIVSAAASLTEPLTSCSRDFGGSTVRLSFAGSDELAAQIRRGVRPDVFAAANTDLPEQLAGEGRVEAPLVFATNRLVIAVAPDSAVRRVEDLAGDGVVVAAGAASVPVGAYTEELLARLPAETGRRIRANVRTAEPDVRGVLGKVAQGAADAGFVYATDVAAAEGRLRAVELPARLRSRIAYGAAVVRGAPHPEAAARFVHDLAEGRCARALRAAGFGAPEAP